MLAPPPPIPPSLPLRDAEVPEMLSQVTEGRTSVVAAARGSRRKPRKLGRGAVVVVAVASSSFPVVAIAFLLLGATRSVAAASTRRGTLFGMSGTIVQDRSRRQDTVAALPREADAERAGKEEEEEEVAASSKEEADDVDGADDGEAAERGLFRA